MASAVSIARHLLSEASSGTAPTVAADDANSNDLAIDYGGGDAVWTSIPSGNGLDYTAPVLTANTAIMTLSDIANNGNIGSSFPDGTKELSYIICCDIDIGNNSGPRLIQIGTNNGDGDFAIATRVSNWLFRWSKQSGGSDIVYPVPSGGYGTGAVTVHVVINSAKANAADRIKVYYDKVLQTAISGTIALNESIDLDNSSYNFSLGNRETLDRNINGKIYYSELFTGVLTDQQVIDSYDAIIVDNDSNWAGDGVSVPIPAGSMSLGGFIPTVQVTEDVAVEVGTGSLSMSGFIPTIQEGADVAVEVGTGSLFLSGFIPTIQTGADVSVNIPSGSMEIDGKIPTVTKTDNVEINVPIGAMSLDGFAPVAIITDNIEINVPIGSMSVTGFVPDVISISGIQIDIPTGNLSLAGLVPSVALGPFNANIPTGSLALAGFVPTIISVLSPDYFFPVSGKIDGGGVDVVGFINENGISVESYIYDVMSVSGVIDDESLSVAGKIDSSGVTVMGKI